MVQCTCKLLPVIVHVCHHSGLMCFSLYYQYLIVFCMNERNSPYLFPWHLWLDCARLLPHGPKVSQQLQSHCLGLFWKLLWYHCFCQWNICKRNHQDTQLASNAKRWFLIAEQTKHSDSTERSILWGNCSFFCFHLHKFNGLEQSPVWQNSNTTKQYEELSRMTLSGECFSECCISE